MTKSSSSQSDDQLDDDMDLLDQDLSDTDDWDDSDISDETPPPKKKKGGMFNVIIIGIGVLAFFGIMYFQMVSTSPQTEVLTAESQTSTSIDSSQSTPNTPVVTQPDVMVPQPEQVATEPGPLTPMPEFEATETPVEDMRNITNQSMTVSAADPVSPNANEGMGVPTTPAAIVPPVVTLTPNDPAPVALQAMEDDPRNSMGTTIETSEETVKDVAASTATRSDTLIDSRGVTAGTRPAITTADSASVAEASSPVIFKSKPEDLKTISELNATVQTLSNRVVELESELAKRDRMTQVGSSEPKKEQQEMGGADPSRTFSGDGLVSNVVQTSSTGSVIDQPAVQEMIKKRYILRAVSNGTAYISPNMTSPIVAVQVGSDIDGFGTVKDIRTNKSGRWQVVTTSGVITAK